MFSNLFGQNLVLNPSFESYSNFQNYPIYYNEEFFILNWTNIYNNVYSTPDFIHRDDSLINKIYAKKGCVIDYAHGDAVVGIGLISAETGQMEHISGIISESLVKGNLYRVSIKIRFCSSMSAIKSEDIQIAFSSDSAIFKLKNSTNPKLQTRWTETSETYSNLFSNKNIVADVILKIPEKSVAETWTEISAVFKATGNEKFITIGLFTFKNISVESVNKYFNEYLKASESKKMKKMKKIHRSFPILNYNPECSQFSETHPISYYLVDDIRLEEIMGK